MDKVVAKVNQTRLNWWQAFKLGISLKGYNYYMPPAELKYRYPAPGSVAHDQHSYPHLFKQHWKTPYRESPYNIQKKERRVSNADNTVTYVAELPSLNASDAVHAAILRDQQPSYEGKTLMFDQDNMTEEEKRAELWHYFESSPQLMEDYSQNDTPWDNDLDQDYFPKQYQFRERGFSGFENDPIMREVIVELEFMIEHIIGARRIKEKQVQMYKGTVKKWQILDDQAHDREQVEKLQAAARAPLPDELELYEEKHSKPMTLPINNTNVSQWRDDQRAIDGIGADFDPKFIEYDRERRKKFFLERYEKPLELQEQ